MNRLIKSLIIFVAGAGVGSFVTALITKRYYEQVADAEIADVIERFKKKENSEPVIKGKIIDPNDKTKREAYRDVMNSVGKEYKTAAVEDDTDYDPFEDEDEEDDIDEYRDMLEDAIHQRRRELKLTRSPWQIVDDDFDDVDEVDEEIFDDADVLYYIGNRVFVDNDDDDIDSPELYFGEAAVEWLRSDKVEAGEELCVRNNKLEIIFNIHPVNDIWLHPSERPLDPATEGPDSDEINDWNVISARERMRRMNAFKEKALREIIDEADDPDLDEDDV